MPGTSTRTLSGSRTARESFPIIRWRTCCFSRAWSLPETVRTYYVYFSADMRIKAAPTTLGYESLLTSGRNLVKNPSFELGDKLPADWPVTAQRAIPTGTVMGLDGPVSSGDAVPRCIFRTKPSEMWVGWRSKVPVAGGRSYLYASWAKCEDFRDGSVFLFADMLDAAGKNVGGARVAPSITATRDWTLLSQVCALPPEATTSRST